MSSITIEDVKKAAKLSAFALSDDELAYYQGQLESIVGYIDKLSSVDTSGVEPTYQVTGLKNVKRKDEIIDYGVSQAELLKNAPDQQDGQIKVGRVL